MSDDWDDWEDEDDLDEDGQGRLGFDGDGPLSPPADLLRSVPYGFLVAVPLLVGYELSQTLAEGAPRSTAAVLALRALEPLGGAAVWARRLLILGLAVAALVACARRHWALGPAWLRTLVEGAVGALLLGPAVVGLYRLLPAGLGELPLPPGPEGAPPLERALLVTGAAAYEELLFRLLVLAALMVLARPLLRFLGTPEAALGRAVWGVALVGQALLFAAAHLEVVAGPLGAGGEAFHAATFTYRFGLGILLGLVMRWRGLGTTIWMHAFYNLALLLGASPEVFR